MNRKLVGRRVHELAIEPQHLRQPFNRVQEQTRKDGAHGMQPVFERRHDAEIAATARGVPRTNPDGSTGWL